MSTIGSPGFARQRRLAAGWLTGILRESTCPKRREPGVNMLRTVKTSHLSIGYFVDGPANGEPVVLLHGWPDDALTWNRVVAALHTAGYRTYAPYLRGFGPTRIEEAATQRSGQLSALGADVIAFGDALGLDRFALVGHD